ncbi:hypothetical protein QBC39DRAFT_372209 [Podospora conica]|nr:hypothetical protein QBC39DRAFT_372209 [Schizothecium conicum]
MASQSTLEILARDPRVQAMVTDIYTPDLVAYLKRFDTWICTTSPEERERIIERLWEGCINPPVPKPNTTIFGGQYIPRRLSATERIVPAHFLTGSGGFTQLPNVLVSPEYKVSYIFAETLTALGHWFIPLKVNPSRNPKGGKPFTPIGMTTLYVNFSDGAESQDSAPPVFINALVLDQPAVETGVAFVVGRPDVERIYGTASPF